MALRRRRPLLRRRSRKLIAVCNLAAIGLMLVIYLILTGAVVFIINRVEAAMRLPGFGLGDGQ